MKKSIVACICISFIGIWGCSTDDTISTQNSGFDEVLEKNTSNNPIIPEIIRNQVVAKFTDPTLNEIQKKNLRSDLEQTYDFKILKKEVCDCDPQGPELWTIDTIYPDFKGIQHLVEDLVTNYEDDSGDEAVEEGRAMFDYQFYIHIADKTLSGRYTTRLSDKIIPSTNPDYVNIAIVDTGIDYDYFNGPILYNTGRVSNGSFGDSGWDYVNHDKDMRDDNGHGSKVAKIINSELTTHQVPHQLLSVKAFDENGRGSYYDIVCSLNYISKLNNIDVVNMSFGWYGLKKQKILKTSIQSMESHVLFIASAGNRGLNVDEDIAHFPSGYAIENLIGVGGYELEVNGEVQMPDLLDFMSIVQSNYGLSTIDIAAPIDGYHYTMSQESNLTIDPVGTSFSAAYIAATAGKLYDKDQTSLQLNTAILNSAHRALGLQDFIHQGRVVVKQ